MCEQDPTRLMGPFGWLRLAYHFPNFCKLLVRLFKDRRMPLWPKILLVASVVYVFVPLDLWFDWVPPGLGYIDDLVVVLIAFKLFIKHAPRDVILEHVKRIDTEDPRRKGD